MGPHLTNACGTVTSAQSPWGAPACPSLVGAWLGGRLQPPQPSDGQGREVRAQGPPAQPASVGTYLAGGREHVPLGGAARGPVFLTEAGSAPPVARALCGPIPRPPRCPPRVLPGQACPRGLSPRLLALEVELRDLMESLPSPGCPRPPQSQLGATGHRLEPHEPLLGLQGGWSEPASGQTLSSLTGDPSQGPRS